MAGIKFDITGDNRNVLDSFKGVQQGVRRMESAVEKSGNSIESMFQRVTSSALGGVKQLATGIAGLTALMESGNFIKSLYGDMGRFNVAMREVSTLSEDVTNNLESYKRRVVELCSQIAIAPEAAAKALYQIESAGHHGSDGLKVLEESAKGAIGGVTDTAIAADAITTILNSYSMSAEQAAHVNDLLFTTVRLGKTTYGELGSYIAQVTPIASAYGVAIEDVLAAIASLTKAGTKTSIAIREVRDSITAATNSLGDGAFKGRTFLEAMDEIAEKSKGSESALKSDLSKLQAMNAVLALTGQNAASARKDFEEMKNSTGAATAAYEKMAESAGNATTRLRNNIFAYFMPIGDEIRSMGRSIAESMNEAFDDGSMQSALQTLELFIASYATYRGLLAANGIKNSLVASSEIAATNAAYEAEIAQLQTILPLKQAEAQSDIEIAVAEGRLTPEKAALITSLREEAAAHLANLQAQAAEAKAAFEQSTTIASQIALRLEEAETAVAAAEAKYAAAVMSGNQTSIETAELELNTAESIKNSTAKELQAAREVASAAATKAATTAKAAESAATVVDTAAQGADATATGVLAGVKLTLKKAIDAVNASFLASPIFWMGAAIVGVTYLVYKLCTAESATEAATRKANEAMEEQNKLNEERRSKVQNLLRTIQDKNQTELAQLSAYNELKTLVPEITDKYSQEALAAAEAAESQKELNAELEKQQYEEAKKKVEEYRKEVERLQAIIDSDDGRAKKPVVAQRIENARVDLPLAEANLKQWEAVVRRHEDLQRELAEKSRPLEIRIQEARENVGVMKSISDFYARAKDMTDHWQEANEKINYVTGQTRLEAFIEEAEAELDELRRKQAENPIDEKLRLELTEKQKILNALKDIKEKAESDGSNKVDFYLNAQFKFNWQFLQSQLKKALAKLTGLTADTVEGGATSLEEEYIAAKERYEKAVKKLKEIDANRSKYTKEDRIAAQSELSTAKDAYAAVGGDVSSKSKDADKKAENERAQRIKQEARYQELLRRQKVDREREEQDMQFSITQARIDAMQDGAQKTVSQIELDFKKQEATIRRGYEDLKQKKIDQARQLWEANPANKNKDFFKSEAYIEAQKPDRIQLGKGDAALVAIQEQEKRILSELGKGEIFNALQEQFGKGNVDVLARPLVDAAELAKKAWEDVGDGYATVFSSQYGITDNTGKVREILVTPILPDGSVLSKEELENYLHDKLEGAEDLMSADSLGIVIAVDVDEDGNAGEKLHELQEQLYDIPEEKTIQIKTLYDDATNVGLVNLNAQLEANEKAYKESLKKFQIEDTQYQIEYLKNYGTFEEQKRAISAEYDAKIAEESNEWAKKSLQEQKKAALAEAELAIMRFKIDWGSVFGNLANRSIKELEKIKRELETLSNSGQIQDITQIKELQDALSAIYEEFAARKGGFTALRDSLKDMRVASNNLTKAEEALVRARTEGNAEAIRAAEKEVQLARERRNTAEKSVDASKKAAAQLLNTIANLDFTSFSGVLDGLKNLSPTIDSVFKTNISGIFQNMGDEMTQAIGSLGDMIVQLVDNLGELFSSGYDDTYIREQLIMLDALKQSIDYLADKLENGNLTEALEAYEKGVETIKQQITATQTTLSDAMNASNGGCWEKWKDRAFGSADEWINEKMSSSDWKELSDFLGKTLTKATDLWNLTPEELSEALNNLPNIRAKINQALEAQSKEGPKNNGGQTAANNAREALEQYLSLTGALEKAEEKIAIYLSQISFDDLKSDFRSALSDMEKDAKDFGNDIAQTLSNALLNMKLNEANGINKKLEDWYNELVSLLAKKANGGISDKDFQASIESLKKSYAAYSLEAQEYQKWANEIAGVSTEKYEQNASSGGWQSMGQDTADELNGRFTALQISGERISEGIASMVTTLATLSALADGRNLTLTEIRNLMITNNAYLEDILDANKKAYQKFEQQLDKIVTQTK